MHSIAERGIGTVSLRLRWVAGAVIGADPRELGDRLEDRGDPRGGRRRPDLGVVAIARDENYRRRAGSLAGEIELAVADLDLPTEGSARRKRLGLGPYRQGEKGEPKNCPILWRR